MKTTTCRFSYLIMVTAGAMLAPALLSAQVTVPPVPTVEPSQRTIFYGFKPGSAFEEVDSARRRAAVDSAIPARVYESLSSPFVSDRFAIERGAHCAGFGVDGMATGGGVLLSGTMSVLVPRGTSGEAGSRWLLVRRGPSIPGLGEIVIPTGVARLTSPGTAVTPGRAEVVAQFDAISCTDALLPLGAPVRRVADAPSPVSDGARGRVVWIQSEALLPTLQHAMIVDIGADAGLGTGDRLTIYAEDGAVAAKANVVRVDPRSASVRLVSQATGALVAGLSVRVTEKLP